MQQNKKLSYCDFCKYRTNAGCMAKPNSAYCTEAKNEYWQYINEKKQPQVKSLRKWDRK
jgi:hypothetical protein